MKVTWRRVLAVLVLAVIVVATAMAPSVLRRVAFFRVRQVEVVGARYLDEADVVRRLALSASASTFDRLAPTRSAALAIPGVLGASVERRLPATLRVTVREASPIAMTELADRVALMDSIGRVLPFDATRVATRLPIAARDSAVAALLARMKRTDRGLYDRIDVAERDQGDVVLMVGPRRIRIRPEADADVLRALTAVIEHLNTQSIGWRELDARYRNRMFVVKSST